MLRAKPAEAVDGCYDKSTPPLFIADDAAVHQQAELEVQRALSGVLEPAQEAGGPLAANVLKCQLKPVDAKDYTVAFTPAELARLKAIFPGGVCDWSKPGVNQAPVVPWASFGPSPKNLVFDVTKP